MANQTFQAKYTAYLQGKSRVSYAGARDASYACRKRETSAIYMGQYYSTTFNEYNILRSCITFDVSDLQESVDISTVIVRLWQNVDSSATDFDVSVVPGSFNVPIEYADYNDLHILNLGTINTANASPTGWNEITLNSDGVSEFKDQFSGGDTIYFGIRSSRDLSGTTPTGNEFWGFQGVDKSTPPEIVVYYSNWPSDRHPDAPAFPSDGFLNLDTQAVIQAYIEDMWTIQDGISDREGNVDLGTSYGIELLDTSLITWDDANSRVVFNDLIAGSVSLHDLNVSTNIAEGAGTINITAANASVAGNATLSDAAFANVKNKFSASKLGRLVFSPQGSAPASSDGSAILWYDSSGSNKKMMISLNPTGGGSPQKYATLADWDTI
jgi:hypothetical protein